MLTIFSKIKNIKFLQYIFKSCYAKEQYFTCKRSTAPASTDSVFLPAVREVIQIKQTMFASFKG